MLRRCLYLVTVSVAFFALAACGGDSGDDDDAAGLVAIGHSALTGHNADPARPDAPAKEYSWATGTASEVYSIYQRMLALDPDLEGKVYNGAVGGAQSGTLDAQAQAALRHVAQPRIAIIATIANDIRCDGTDAANVAAFGGNVASALAVFRDESPGTIILLVSVHWRPAPEDFESIAAIDPEWRQHFAADGLCDWYTADGGLSEAAFKDFNAIVDAYEAEQERVCATVLRCRTDGGAAGNLDFDPLADYSPDYLHLNIQGLAALAEHIWPVVEALLDQ